MIGDIFASVRSSHDFALLCDGSAIPSGVDYDELRALVGLNTPDLRDMVLRGNRTGRALLSYELDGNKSHSHSGSSVASFTGSTQSTSHSHPGSSVGSFSGNNQIASHSHSITGGDHSHPIPYSSVNGSNLFCSEERGNSQSGTINNMSSASHSHGISGGDHSHVMTHGHTLSIASEGHTHVMTHGHTLSISGDGNTETTVKNISVNFFIYYKEVVTLTQSDFDLFVSSCPSIAKKADLQFTDIQGRVWDLMDLITANLPFRNV